MNGPLRECKHANIFEMLALPVSKFNNLMELRNYISMILCAFLFEIIAFVCWIESEDVLLFEYLEIMKDNYHAYFDFLLLII